MPSDEKQELLKEARELCREFGELRDCGLRAEFSFWHPWTLFQCELNEASYFDRLRASPRPDSLELDTSATSFRSGLRLGILFERGALLLSQLGELWAKPDLSFGELCDPPGMAVQVREGDLRQQPGLHWAAFLCMRWGRLFLYPPNEDGLPPKHVPPGAPWVAWMDDVIEVCSLASSELLTFLLSEPAKQQLGPNADKDDTKDDTRKNSARKPRRMNNEAWDCVRIYRQRRKKGDEVPMEEVVAEYAKKNDGSFTGIMRRLNDHPDEWKHDTKDDKKTTR